MGVAAVWPEHLFELSNNFELMHVYSGGKPANLRNCQVRTSVTRGWNARIELCAYVMSFLRFGSLHILPQMAALCSELCYL